MSAVCGAGAPCGGRVRPDARQLRSTTGTLSSGRTRASQPDCPVRMPSAADAATAQSSARRKVPPTARADHGRRRCVASRAGVGRGAICVPTPYAEVFEVMQAVVPAAVRSFDVEVAAGLFPTARSLVVARPALGMGGRPSVGLLQRARRVVDYCATIGLTYADAGGAGLTTCAAGILCLLDHQPRREMCYLMRLGSRVLTDSARPAACPQIPWGRSAVRGVTRGSKYAEHAGRRRDRMALWAAHPNGIICASWVAAAWPLGRTCS